MHQTQPKEFHQNYYHTKEKKKFETIAFVIRVFSIIHLFLVDYLMFGGRPELLAERISFVAYVVLYVCIRGAMYLWYRKTGTQIPERFTFVTMLFDIGTMIVGAWVYGMTIIIILGFCLLFIYSNFLFGGLIYHIARWSVVLGYIGSVFTLFIFRPEHIVIMDNPYMTLYLYALPGMIYYFAAHHLVRIMRIAFENRAKEVAEEQQTRADFIDASAHQLRTPLASTKWALDTLLSGDTGHLTTGQTQMLRRIYQVNDDMVQAVNALLHMIRREDSQKYQYQLQPVSVHQLLNEAIEHHQVLLSDWIIETRLPSEIEEVYVLCDPTQFTFALENILSNAIKYGGIQKKELVFGIDLENAGWVTFSIQDFGLGIPLKEQGNIFQKYYRASNVNQVTGSSTGIGLYVVKKIMQGHQGTVWFESVEGEGTTFFLKLKRVTKGS